MVLETGDAAPAGRTPKGRAVGAYHGGGTRPAERVSLEGWELGVGVVRSELRQAIRALARRPVASATVIGTIAVSVGTTAAVFSVVNGVLLRPLPYPDSDELVQIWQTKPEWLESSLSQLRAFAERLPLSVPTFNDWVDEAAELEALGAYAHRSRVWQRPEGAEVLTGVIATSGVFDAIAVAPILGRTLEPTDDAVGAPAVAVLSHTAWQTHFGGDPAVLGRSLLLREGPHTVVGVMPPGLGFPYAEDIELWTSLSDSEKQDERDSQFLSVVGRLRDGGSLDAARAELGAIQERLSEVHPDEQGDQGVRMLPLLDAVVGDTSTTLWFLLGLMGLVLLIACANIASVLSAMASARRRELAVRAALGAGAAALARGRLLDGAVLAALGGGIGILISLGLMPLLLAVLPANLPRRGDVVVDGRVLAFTILVTAIVTVLVGLAPAAQASRSRPATALRESSRGAAGGQRSARFRAALVTLETAAAFSLMVGAGLLGKSFLRLWSVDRGFSVESLAMIAISPDSERFPEPEDRDRLRTLLLDELGSIPGASVATTNQVPLSGSVSSSTFHLEGMEEAEAASLLISVVSRSYFDVLGIPLIGGRNFEEGDVRDVPQVAIANQAMADRYWPDGSAIGQRLRDDEDDPWITIVGVAGNVRHQGLTVEAEPKLYLPASQSARAANLVVVRVVGDMTSTLALARERIRAAVPSTPVVRTEILEERVRRSVSVPRFRMFFVVGLAMIAGLLALLGIYGLVAFAVAQKTREIGVRIALGADRIRVVRSVMVMGPSSPWWGWWPGSSPLPPGFGCSGASCTRSSPPTRGSSGRRSPHLARELLGRVGASASSRVGGPGGGSGRRIAGTLGGPSPVRWRVWPPSINHPSC